MGRKIDPKRLSGKNFENEIEPVEKLSSDHSLARKVIRGGAWILSLRIINNLINIIRKIVLARLLAPQDFGLMGIALLAITILETLSKTGIHPALIQKNDNIGSYLNTAWTITSIRSLLVFTVLFLSAPAIAHFFKSPEAIPVIRVLGISTLLTGFRNIGIIYFLKELEFKKQFIYEFTAIIASLVVSIILAIIYRNVWALVWGGLAGNFIRLNMSYLIHSFRPKMKFKKEKFYEMFDFGKWVAGSAILVFIINQGDDIFVGKLLGLSALGLYQMAYFTSNLVATEISLVISQVSFPAYSKLQDALPKLRNAYSEILQLTALISFPIAGGIFILCSDFTLIVLGEKWMPMIPALRILVIWGLIRSCGALTGPLFQAVGRPDIATKLQFAKAILLLITIYPFTMLWGMSGAALAVVLNALLVSPFAHYWASQLINGQINKLIQLLLIPAAGMFTMCTMIYFLKALVLRNVTVISLAALILAGAVVYGCVVLVLDRGTGFQIRNSLSQSLDLLNLKTSRRT